MNACEDLCMGVQILLATHCASSGTIRLLGTIEVAEALVNSTCTRSAKPLGGHMSGRNGTETRRSGRVTLRVPLKIFEPNTSKRFLVEEAYFAEGKPLGWTYRSKSTGESIPKTIAGQSGYRGKRGVANCLPGSHAP